MTGEATHHKELTREELFRSGESGLLTNKHKVEHGRERERQKTKALGARTLPFVRVC